MATGEKQQMVAPNDASSVLAEYLELFDCLGYRYKYFMAPNALLDWFGILEVRTPLRIHEFLLQKFGGKSRHANFTKAVSCGPIETSSSHMRTRQMPTHEVELINYVNKVPELTSLKNRAESDVEDGDVVMAATPPSGEPATSSNRVEQTAATTYSSDESEEYNVRRCKRMKYNAPSPFQYLKRLPTKKPQETVVNDDDSSSSSSSLSSDDDDEIDGKHMVKDVSKKVTKPQMKEDEYSQLYYLEAEGAILKSKSRHLGGGVAGRRVRLRLAYRKHRIDGSTQFALIIYERYDQKNRTIRSRRMLDFSLCNEDDEPETSEDTDCSSVGIGIGVSVAPTTTFVRSIEDRVEHETIPTIQLPTGPEISTALEQSAFTIQAPIQRTPTKTTPIPPGTPKRRARSSQLNMSGLVPLPMSSTKKLSSTSGTAPKLSAARSLRL